MSVYFGLHVGHSSACLAVHRDGRLDVVANDAGDRTTPAYVGINEGEILVGESAKQLCGRKPALVVKNNKKILSMTDGDLKEAVNKSGPPHCPKIALSTGNTEYVIEAGEGMPAKRISATSVQTHIFKYMHDIAASHATTQVEEKNTVLTVPYNFTSKQRNIMLKCAEHAGFHVVQVISEPASACMAYSIGQLDQTECLKCLIYRCGGSTLTASVAFVNGGMISIVDNVTGDEGGDNITTILSDYLAEEFQRKFKVDPRETKRGKTKLYNNAETVKHILSTLDTAKCYIESLYDGIDFSTNVTRARFENELSKVLPSLIDPIHKTLANSGIKASDIDKVILCGGTSKIPRLQKHIASLFPNREVLASLSPDEVLALGAASQASLLNEAWLDENTTGDESEYVRTKLIATKQSVVYNINSSDDALEHPSEALTVTLIPSGVPIPTRRSDHLTDNDISILPGKEPRIKITLFTKSKDGTLTQITTLTLKNVNKESKVSLSCHIHRDASVHFALTDKSTGQCDQVTLQGPKST